MIIGALLSLIIYALVVGLLLWLLFYVLQQFPLPDPMGRIVRVAAIAVAVIIMVLILLDLFGAGGPLRLPRL
jgi:hypothetical protein